MNESSNMKANLVALMDKNAPQRQRWLKRYHHYYEDIAAFYRFIIPEGSSVLEIGCGTGQLLDGIHPRRGVGIDISPQMIALARKQFPHYDFYVMDAEQFTLDEQFDYVILSDSIGYFEDVQLVLQHLNRACHPHTRLIITYQNFIWSPFFHLTEKLGLKMLTKKTNWLNMMDVCHLLELEGFEVIKTNRRFLFPFALPLIATVMNRYTAHLPLVNRLCLTNCIVARPAPREDTARLLPNVSIIIPARNEAGNIKEAIDRMPVMGSSTEIIFVEGHSTDHTLSTIQNCVQQYRGPLKLQYAVQDGKGKGDAVRKGFALASGDILMILDADLSVAPEELPKFYHAIQSGRGEFVNGSRLVYPVEKQAMQTLNMIANHFFSILFTWLLGQRIKDTLCGTKVLWKRDYQLIERNRSFFGDFDPFGDFDLLFGAAKLHLTIVEIPIHYKARKYGATNISRFHHGWLLLKMVVFAMNRIKFV